jgi:SAM-dependent methyltransferase
LADAGRSAVGVDLSGGMLAHAHSRGLTVAQGSATSLPFADESFDVVCSFKVLAHVTEIETALHEMARVTRPGGKLLLEFYNRRSLRYVAKRLAGPQRIGASATDEAAIPTRWDTRATIEAMLPSDLALADTAGVRIFTPTAIVHRIPLVRSVFGWLERTGRDSPVRNFGGFLVAILEKSG